MEKNNKEKNIEIKGLDGETRHFHAMREQGVRDIKKILNLAKNLTAWEKSVLRELLF